MTGIERYSIEGPNDPKWLPMRQQDVTASDVGALFGVHQYKTIYALYRAKRDDTAMATIDTAQLQRGRDLEPIVLEKLKKRYPTWTFRAAREYWRDTETHLGATPDAYAEDDEAKFVICELKTVSPYEWKRRWAEHGPPEWILLQALTQLYLTDASYALVCPFDWDAWELREPYRIDPYPEVVAEIRDRSKAFMQCVAEGREPEPDFARDGAIIAKQFLNVIKGKAIDLRADNRMPELCRDYLDVASKLKTLNTRRDALSAELQSKLQDAEFAQVVGYDISNKLIHRKAYQVPETDYRRLRIVPDHDDEADNADR